MSFLIFNDVLSFTKEFDSEHIIAMFKYNELKFHFRNWILSPLNILQMVPLRRFQWNAPEFSLGFSEHLLLRQPPRAERLANCQAMAGLRKCRGKTNDKGREVTGRDALEGHRRVITGRTKTRQRHRSFSRMRSVTVQSPGPASAPKPV